MLKMFLLILLEEKNTAGSEVFSHTASEAGPGGGGGALSCITNDKGKAGW